MCFGGASDGGASVRAATEAAQKKLYIAAGQDQIDSQFSGFDNAFYSKAAQAYRDFAQPQLDRQSAGAKAQLAFGLDRAGLTNSSAAGKQMADLDFNIGTQQQAVEDQAQATAADTRSKVATAKQSLESQLNIDGDAAAANANAGAQAAALAVKPAYSSLGSLFSNVTSGLATAAQGAGLVSGYAGGSGAKLYSSGSSGTSSRVVN